MICLPFSLKDSYHTIIDMFADDPWSPARTTKLRLDRRSKIRSGWRPEKPLWPHESVTDLWVKHRWKIMILSLTYVRHLLHLFSTILQNLNLLMNVVLSLSVSHLSSSLLSILCRFSLTHIKTFLALSFRASVSVLNFRVWLVFRKC